MRKRRRQPPGKLRKMNSAESDWTKRRRSGRTNNGKKSGETRFDLFWVMRIGKPKTYYPESILADLVLVDNEEARVDYWAVQWWGFLCGKT
jgi:hypothetical protein